MNTDRSLLPRIVLAALFMSIGAPSFTHPVNSQSSRKSGDEQHPLVTFVELGSVKCIPCRQMQPVMKAIEEKYGNQVDVIFYDVWKDDQVQYADKYGIRVIPTQIFLDKNGKEFFRHEGFYPEAEIDKLLQKRGLKVLKRE